MWSLRRYLASNSDDSAIRRASRTFGAREFLTFLARRASKVASWKLIYVLDTRHFFSLGRRRPKPVPRYYIPLHSAGLRPGKTKSRQRFAVGITVLLGAAGNLASECDWKPFYFFKFFTKSMHSRTLVSMKLKSPFAITSLGVS